MNLKPFRVEPPHTGAHFRKYPVYMLTRFGFLIIPTAVPVFLTGYTYQQKTRITEKQVSTSTIVSRITVFALNSEIDLTDLLTGEDLLQLLNLIRQTTYLFQTTVLQKTINAIYNQNTCT